MMYNPVDTGITVLAERFGISNFILRYATCLLGSFVFNLFLRRIPDNKVNLKCFFITSVSMFYLFGVLNLYQGFQTLFISTTFTYLISRFYKSRFMPFVNFGFVMGHLALNHFSAQFYDSEGPEAIDITGSQMVLVMKLTAFAWSYYDGSYSKDHKFEDLTEYQKLRAVKKHPSFLKFMAFAYFYPTLLTGPSFDFADFDRWLDGSLYDDLPPTKRFKNGKKQTPKNDCLALWKALQGLGWIALSMVSPSYITTSYMFKPEFGSKSFFFKIHYFFFLGLTYRFKYYAAWTIAEASCILCGLGYNGYDSKTQKTKWNRVQNISIWGMEMGQNCHETLEAWNMNTNKWLKYYVYLRVARKGKKPGFRSTMFTFLTSAFWHGTRPGYYLTFATGALCQTCGKFFRRHLRPIFLAEDGITPVSYKWIYDVVCFYVTKITFGYMVQPFIVLGFKESIYAWGSVYFVLHLGIALTFFLFRGPYAKSVIAFCTSKQPKEAKRRSVENDIAKKSSSLGDILADKQAFEKENSSEMDISMGIPPVDKTYVGNAKKEWAEFLQDYNDWRNEKGLEIEEQNLLKAFQDFKEEITMPNNAKKMSFENYSPKTTLSGDKKD
ncbi:ZYRO0D14212p [Zygosaccharomyces rouxii]|uniref:ZYRO0D14212p n=1 Tax=Zygosaccharomyces rouxii (strain ATCC 2623 / CBS 732 / NBRC 1130 / NCYC 568 / NRRL Y-229) TaxID=559307 RepID=C5DWE7_ZYGRC|nr:uncharacterized protein ZYRO0D14212g [Zygosaccharomyces rouxii]KAH9201027.1 MBOAT, membrane-bound O-acyltransferase family-domain-containing protein [Zygosaccharomyces rouxii]CAR28116.1 ZYRO0D14212p [Zygosaccharomyces rouxii]